MPGKMTTPTTPEPPPKPEPPTEPEPFTRVQRQEYMAKHYPQTLGRLQEHVEKTLHFYNTIQHLPTDDILWEWFQGSFSLWSPHDFKNLGTDSQKELRRYLCYGGVFVRPDNKAIAQALYDTTNEDKQHIWTHDDIAKCKEDLKKGLLTSF
jgi:hypothetical protein